MQRRAVRGPCVEIVGQTPLHQRRFLRQHLRAQGLRDRVRELRLQLEQRVRVQLAVVGLGPQVLVGFRIDQLRIDAHAFVDLLHAAFEHVRNAQFAGDLAQIFLRIAALHHRGTRNHLERPDLDQLGQQIVVHAVHEGICFGVVREILERQHRDGMIVRDCAQLRHRNRRRHGWRMHVGRIAHHSLGRHVEEPRHHQRDRKTDQQCQRDRTRHPIGQLHLRRQRRDDLDQQPRHHQVSASNLEDLAALEFGEKIHRAALRLAIRVDRPGRSMPAWRVPQLPVAADADVPLPSRSAHRSRQDSCARVDCESR